MSTPVTPSSRVMNFVQATVGSLTLAAGASHIASSFCTPLIARAPATGAPTLMATAGNSTGVIAGPWPKVAPKMATGSDFKSQASAVAFMYLSVAGALAAVFCKRMKYSVFESSLHEVAPNCARSTGPAILTPLAAS
jgi:hypothetical protein